MGRRKTTTETAPDVFDHQIQAREIVEQVAAATEIDKPVTGYIANSSAIPRPHNFANQIKKLPGKLLIPAGDLKVELIDKGDNAAGIGIRVVTPEGRKLSDAEKEIVRDHMKGENGRPGLSWDRHAGMWIAEIGADSPPSRNVAIRLNAESRTERLADALKQHQADPKGYVELVKQQREKAAEQSRIPD